MCSGTASAGYEHACGPAALQGLRRDGELSRRAHWAVEANGAVVLSLSQGGSTKPCDGRGRSPERCVGCVGSHPPRAEEGFGSRYFISGASVAATRLLQQLISSSCCRLVNGVWVSPIQLVFTKNGWSGTSPRFNQNEQTNSFCTLFWNKLISGIFFCQWLLWALVSWSVWVFLFHCFSPSSEVMKQSIDPYGQIAAIKCSPLAKTSWTLSSLLLCLARHCT